MIEFELRKVGDKVSREVFMDDGTWTRQATVAAPGPLKHGVVVLSGIVPSSLAGRINY